MMISPNNHLEPIGFFERFAFATGLTNFSLIVHLMNTVKEYQTLPCTDLTAMRDRIHDLTGQFTQITDNETARQDFLNKTNFVSRLVYKAVHFIFSFVCTVAPTVSAFNTSLRQIVRGPSDFGIKVGSTVIDAKTYDVHAMPLLSYIRDNKITEIHEDDTRFSVLTTDGQRLGEMKISRSYFAAKPLVPPGYLDLVTNTDDSARDRYLKVIKEGNLQQHPLTENQAKGKTIVARSLDVSWMEDSRMGLPTRAVMRILTQVALEIFQRDKDLKMDLKTTHDSSYVQIQAGFRPTRPFEKIEKIKELLYQSGIDKTQYPPYKDESSFTLQMLKREKATADKTAFYTKTDDGKETDVKILGSWRSGWIGREDTTTWEPIIAGHPILEGVGPVLPEYWNIDPMASTN